MRAEYPIALGILKQTAQGALRRLREALEAYQLVGRVCPETKVSEGRCGFSELYVSNNPDLSCSNSA